LFRPNTQVNFPIALHFRGEVQPGEHYSPQLLFHYRRLPKDGQRL